MFARNFIVFSVMYSEMYLLFWQSEVLAIFIIAMLFFWQVQQKSLHGFLMTTYGSSCCQSLQKALYDTTYITSETLDVVVSQQAE